MLSIGLDDDFIVDEEGRPIHEEEDEADELVLKFISHFQLKF